MNNYMGNVPSLKNSNAVGQNEIQKAKEKMAGYVTTGQEMTAGMTTAGISNSTSIEQKEVQQAKQKVQSSGFQNTSSNGLS